MVFDSYILYGCTSVNILEVSRAYFFQMSFLSSLKHCIAMFYVLFSENSDDAKELAVANSSSILPRQRESCKRRRSLLRHEYSVLSACITTVCLLLHYFMSPIVFDISIISREKSCLLVKWHRIFDFVGKRANFRKYSDLLMAILCSLS